MNRCWKTELVCWALGEDWGEGDLSLVAGFQDKDPGPQNPLPARKSPIQCSNTGSFADVSPSVGTPAEKARWQSLGRPIRLASTPAGCTTRDGRLHRRPSYHAATVVLQTPFPCVRIRCRAVGGPARSSPPATKHRTATAKESASQEKCAALDSPA